MELISHWISQFGYAGLFSLLMLGIVGLPIPDETLLAFSGYLSSRGEFNLILTMVTAFLGSTCGISISYELGRSLGFRLIRRFGKKFGITMEKIDRVHAWFRRIGKWTLTIGYFIPGVRHLTAYVAGTSKLEYPQFALFAYSGGLLWSSAFVLLGFTVGEHWEEIAHKIHHNALYALIIIVVLAGGYLLLRKLKSSVS